MTFFTIYAIIQLWIGDGTHYKKQNLIHILKLTQKGETPIKKNVVVVDEQGNEYEQTYPKRAKGLVKNGRARFVNENTICLACSPKDILEDEIMENTEAINITYSIEYILSQIVKIQEETDYINGVIEKFSLTGNDDCSDSCSFGSIPGQARAEALGDIVRCRETTNQQMLKLYEKMYDDLKPQNANDKMNIMRKLLNSVACTEGSASEKSSMLESVRLICQENFTE